MGKIPEIKEKPDFIIETYPILVPISNFQVILVVPILMLHWKDTTLTNIVPAIYRHLMA